MKFAVIFLFALVAISHQQYLGDMLWQSPYLPQRVQNIYQPVYDDVEDHNSFFRYSQPTLPIAYQNQEMYPVIYGSQNNEEDDSQARNKGLSRYRPSFLNQRPDGRFFFNLGSGGANLLYRTATFTLTSTVTLATVKSCVPADQLKGTPPPSCRRKREIDDHASAPEDSQFFVSPSEPQLFMATVQPSLARIKGNRQLVIDESVESLRSSKDDGNFGEMAANVVDTKRAQNLREKRFFFNQNLATTTVTTYFFVSTTVTKTVNLGTPAAMPAAGTGSALCLPAGYVVCA